MLYEEIRIKQGISYISFGPSRILYNSEFIIMATSLGTNAVFVLRVHCNFMMMYEHQNGKDGDSGSLCENTRQE